MMSDKQSCLENFFFYPCMTHTLINGKQDSETGFIGTSRFREGREFWFHTCSLSCTFQTLLCGLGFMICSGTLRSSFIQEFEFSGYVADAEFGACCTGCCCPCFSNAQIHRELILRGYPPLHPITGSVRPHRGLSDGKSMVVVKNQRMDDDDDGDDDQRVQKESSGVGMVNERSRLLAQA